MAARVDTMVVTTGTTTTGVPTKGTAHRAPQPLHPTGERRVALLLVLVAGWTWGLLWLARSSGDLLPGPVSGGLRFLAALGPLVVTHLLMRRTLAHEQRSWFWRRYIEVRSVSRGWWAATTALAGGPPLVAFLVDGSGAGTGWLGGLVLILGAAAMGLIQEAAWRGYAWDGLRPRPLVGTALIWAGWVLWAVAWPVIGGLEGLHGISGGWAGWAVLAAALLPQSLLMGWITVRVRPCLTPAALFDGLVLAMWGLTDVGNRGRMIEIVLWWVAAVPVIISWTTSPGAAAGPRPGRSLVGGSAG